MSAVTSVRTDKVFVKSCPRQSAFRIHDFKNPTSGKNMNKTKQGKAKDGLAALYDTKTGKLKTGLGELVPNPYVGRKDLPQDFKWAKDEDRILRQHELEIKYNLPMGYLTDSPPSKEHRKDPSKVTFFQNFVYHLNDGTTVLNLNEFKDEIAYWLFRASKYVANSEVEWRSYKWPKALYYISHEQETEELKYSKEQHINKAIATLHTEDMDTATMRKFCRILNLSKGEPTEEQAYNFLSKFIKDGAAPGTKNSSIDQYNELYELMQTSPGRERLEAWDFLKVLQEYKVVGNYQGTYLWFTHKLNIGFRMEEAITFLIDPNKQKEHEELRKELKARMVHKDV